jgi:CHAT domain-containing protein
MKKFYRGMTIDGLGPAESLRKAQLDLKSERRWKNPFFWGAFRTLGFCHNTAETEMREKEYHEK